jgi:hypothetical protein
MVAATVELVTASRALEVTAPQVSHRLGKYVSMPDKIMIPLAPTWTRQFIRAAHCTRLLIRQQSVLPPPLPPLVHTVNYFSLKNTA